MKYLFPLFLVVILWSCAKVEPTPQSKIDSKAIQSLVNRLSVWPTYIKMGNDTIVPRIASITLTGYSAFLSTCGTAPDTEAPQMGINIYPIQAASYTTLTWENGKPVISGLKPGNYTFVGNAYIMGYRSCDDSTMNDNYLDTINITVQKWRKLR